MGLRDILFPTYQAADPTQPLDVDASLAPYYPENQNFYFYGIQAAGRAEAMSVPTVSRALGVIQTISSLPMVTRNEATGEKVSQPRVVTNSGIRILGMDHFRFILPPVCLWLRYGSLR